MTSPDYIESPTGHRMSSKAWMKRYEPKKPSMIAPKQSFIGVVVGMIKQVWRI